MRATYYDISISKSALHNHTHQKAPIDFCNKNPPKKS
jgi:hypothetical protein